MNPVIPLGAAAATWIVLLAANNAWVSATVLVAAQLFAYCRLRNPSVLATTTALSVPVGLSMLLVHVAYGSERIFAFVTADGLATAGGLTLRFAALMSAVLAATTTITVPELAKALRRCPRLAYVVCSTLQILPRSRDTLLAIRDANRVRGRNIKGPIRALKYVGLPLITRLLYDGATRAIPLEVAGFDGPQAAEPTTHSLRQIIGPSGSGVTRALTELYESTPGAVMLTADPRAHITYLCGSVAEELAFGLEQRGISDPARVREVAKLLDLNDLMDRPPNKLSGGQTRRLAIGAVAVIPAPLQLFDTPFAGLDAPSRAGVEKLLRSLDAEVVIGDHRLCFTDTPVTSLGELPTIVDLPAPVATSGEREFTVSGRRGGASRSWWQFREPAGEHFGIGPFHKRIARGGVLWLRGPNGSGKTTLMRALAGLDGAVAQPFTVGLMMQDPLDQVIDSTVAAMVPGGGEEHPLDLSARDVRLAQFDSVAADAPAVLCADEPDVGLDTQGRSLMHGRIATYLAAGGCLVLACHDESFVEEVRSYALMEEWRISAEANTYPSTECRLDEG